MVTDAGNVSFTLTIAVSEDVYKRQGKQEDIMDISLENKTVFITGAAGFIGAFLSEELLKRFAGIHVVGIDLSLIHI